MFSLIAWLTVIGLCQSITVRAQPVQSDSTSTADASVEGASLESLLNVKVNAAAKYEQSAREAAASVTVITSEDIERHGYQTLQDVLVNVRGFYISDTRELVFAGTRGFNRLGNYNNRMLLLLNGHTRNEATSGYVSVELDLSRVERIEVIRGPSSALYGTGAMFAVINVVTKSAETLNTVEVELEGGSYGTREAVVTASEQFGHRREIVLSGIWGQEAGQSLYFPRYDTPATNNGIADHQDWQEYYGLNAHATFDDFSLQGNYSHRNMGVPTAQRGALFNHDDSELQERFRFVELNYENALGSTLHLQARAHANRGAQTMISPHRTPEGSGVLTQRVEAWSRWFGGELQLQWDPTPTNRLVVGGEYKRALAALRVSTHQANQVLADEDYRWPFDVVSAYAQNEHRFSRDLALTLGLRFDHYSLEGSAVTPRSALVYHPRSATTLKLLYGEAFRAPGVFESELGDPENNFLPNPDLRSERIRTLEVVWDQQLTPQLLSTVSLYNYWMHDLVNLAYDPEHQITQNRNIGSVNARGVELELNATVRPRVQGYASYTYAFTRDPATDERISNSPSHVAKAGLQLPLPGHLVVAPQMRYESERQTLGGQSTDPFFVTDVTLSTADILQHFKLSASVQNVFDARYSHPATLVQRQDQIVQDGRSFRVHLNVAL